MARFQVLGFFLSAVFGVSVLNAQESPKATTQLLEAQHTDTAPIIDGLPHEPIWSNTAWHPINQKWLGNPYSDQDFSGRYKLAWNYKAL